MEVAVSSKPNPRIAGTVFWNERQIFQDQAVLARMTSIPSAPKEALRRGDFERFARAYEDTEIRRTPAERERSLSVADIPPDVLWLFRNSPQSTFGPFPEAVDGAKRSITKQASTFYADLLVEFVELCLKSPTNTLEYSSILDIRGLVKIEKYDRE